MTHQSEFEPDVVKEQQVNESGQAYINRDLAGEDILIGYKPVGESPEQDSVETVVGVDSAPQIESNTDSDVADGDIDLHSQFEQVVNADQTEADSDSIEDFITDFTSVLEIAPDYWGPRLDTIAKGFLQSIIEYNSSTDTQTMNLTDFCYILLIDDIRREFVSLCCDVGISTPQRYSESYDKIDDVDIQPVKGRIQSWVRSQSTSATVFK